MAEHNENRTFDRYHRVASITCAYFNTDKYFSAKMYNYSEGGLYFESECPFKPGSDILIRVEKSAAGTYPAALNEGYRTITIGEVKWCMEIPCAESGRYGVGIKYCEPVY
jgi:hypothetical protein